jgi:hypothetical protein
LKNSFVGISTRNFRKLLNVPSPNMLKFGKITTLVPFSTATHSHVFYYGRIAPPGPAVEAGAPALDRFTERRIPRQAMSSNCALFT